MTNNTVIERIYSDKCDRAKDVNEMKIVINAQ